MPKVIALVDTDAFQDEEVKREQQAKLEEAGYLVIYKKPGADIHFYEPSYQNLRVDA